MGRVGLRRTGGGSRGGIDLCPELPVNPDVQEPGSAAPGAARRPSRIARRALVCLSTCVLKEASPELSPGLSETGAGGLVSPEWSVSLEDPITQSRVNRLVLSSEQQARNSESWTLRAC